MEITSQFDYYGKTYTAHWVEDEPTSNLTDGNWIDGVHAICFCGDKIVVVYKGKTSTWGPPGGYIEKGETYQEATIREIKEECNMKVIYQEYLGYQDVTDDVGKTHRQARVFCIVEPYGDFEKDPDNDIVEIKLIGPADYKQYFNWSKIGDRIMEKALEMRARIK